MESVLDDRLIRVLLMWAIVLALILMLMDASILTLNATIYAVDCIIGGMNVHVAFIMFVLWRHTGKLPKDFSFKDDDVPSWLEHPLPQEQEGEDTDVE